MRLRGAIAREVVARRHRGQAADLITTVLRVRAVLEWQALFCLCGCALRSLASSLFRPSAVVAKPVCVYVSFGIPAISFFTGSRIRQKGDLYFLASGVSRKTCNIVTQPGAGGTKSRRSGFAKPEQLNS